MKKVVLFLLSVLTFSLQNISAQDGIKIVTNHPDLNLKVKRCAASGKTVIIDLVATNVGTEDKGDFYIMPTNCIAYDDDGNVYEGYEGYIGVKVANQQEYAFVTISSFVESKRTKLLPNIPCKISISIKDFSLEASSIGLLEIGAECKSLNLFGGQEDQRIKVRNIPITRN